MSNTMSILEKRLDSVKHHLTNGRGFNAIDGTYHWSLNTVYVERGIEHVPIAFNYSLDRAALQVREILNAAMENRVPRKVA